MYKSKFFSEDGNDTFEEAIKYVVAERARAMLLEDKDRDENELIYVMLSKITSIICVGKPNRESLC